MREAKDKDRLLALISTLERMAKGELDRPAPLSPADDEIDALARSINALADQLKLLRQESAAVETERALELAQAKEKAERANAAKSLFLRNVSHEMRTPLTAILAITDLLARPLDKGRLEQLTTRLRANAQALLALVEDVLDLARIEEGRITIESGPTHPEDIVKEVLHALEPKAAQKGLRLLWEASPDIPVIVTDARRARQILINLVGNAIKFTQTGEVRVEIQADKEREGVIIRVRDTGIGIAPEAHERLFQPFSQASDGIEQRFGGSGLGLSLARQLARLLSGEVSLEESVPQRGSTFRFDLPSARAFPKPASPPPPPPTPSLSGRRLLVVEDNDDLREIMVDLLRSTGAFVEAATNGEEAIQLGAGEAFDLILMDVRMPVMNGLTATRRLREMGCQTPIVALTADAVAAARHECLSAGCNAVITKPVDFDALLEGLSSHLKGNG